MTLRDEIDERQRVRRKPKSPTKAKPSQNHKRGPRKQIPGAEFVWGARAIGLVIGCNEKTAFELIYNGTLKDAVKQIKAKPDLPRGTWVGCVPKLRALMGGE